MESLFLLIPIGIVFVIVAVWFFIWAINAGQYDNLDTEAHRILFDDDATAGSEPPTASEDPANAARTSAEADPSVAQPGSSTESPGDQGRG